MSYQLSSFRRFPTAFAIAAGSALAFAGVIASSSPASAQTSGGDYRCAALAEQARTAADAAQGSQQVNAQRFVSTGTKLCAAGNERAAAKQFRAALKVAGVDEAADSKVAAR